MNTILIVDDHPLVREGMKKMLLSERFAVVVAESGDEALKRFGAEAKPDLTITDIRMPGMDGFEFAERARKLCPDAKILMLAGMPLSHEVARARECGASGYLPKSTPWRNLVASIRAIIDGAPFQEEVFAEERDTTLTPREHEVLKWLAEGKTMEETSIILGVGVETVKTYCKALRTKLDCANAANMVKRAYELGILRP